MPDESSRSLALEDKDAIRELVIRYAHAVDDGGIEEILEIFTDDVVIEGPFSGRHVGHEGVRGWLGSVPDRPAGQDRHILSGIAVDGAGDLAQATVSFAHLRTALPLDAQSRTELFLSGRFEFALRRVDGRWLIAGRRAVVDSMPH